MKLVKSILSLAIILSNVHGQVKKEVKIDGRIWMGQNLNVDRFRNGDPIPHAKSAAEWIRASENGQPAWCYYASNPANGAKYGKLYNWYAVDDERGLAPDGWHVPDSKELYALTVFFGGKNESGALLKAKTGWNNYKGRDGNGTNESGLSMYPGGTRSNDGSFHYLGVFGYWWSSSYGDDDNAWLLGLSNANTESSVGSMYKFFGLSVRCVKD